jgi:hypothetical protein
MRFKSFITAFIIFAILGFISVIYLSLSTNLIEKAKKELRDFGS